MQIRSKLTVIFTVVVSFILFFCFLSIYILSDIYRKQEFYTRLEDKAFAMAEILIKEKHPDPSLLEAINNTGMDFIYNEVISVYDDDNQLIYVNHAEREMHYDNSLLDNVRNKGQYKFRNGEFEALGLEIDEGNKRYVVVAAAVDRFGFSKLANLRNVLIVMFFGVIGVVAVAGWLYAGRMLAPMTNIMDQVTAFSPNDLSRRVKKGKNKDEIYRLAASFNRLLDRIEGAFKSQKQFVANVSHELRNPLTVITSQLEVTLMKERTPEEYQQTLHSVLEDIRELSTTSNQLLELTRLSDDSYQVNFTNVRIDEVIWYCRETVQKMQSDYRIRVDMQNMPDDERLLQVRGNEALLRSVFINLMENACKFSGKEVAVSLDYGPAGITVEVKDQGPGISREDIEHIFEPFYRSKQESQRKGQGVGLSVVKRIVDLHHAIITVLTAPGEGSRFVVQFTRPAVGPIRPE